MRLVQRLPTTSHYKDAVLNDDEIAPILLQGIDEDRPPAPPSLLDWTPEMGMLTALYESIQSLTALYVGVHSKSTPKVKPLPRPVTAVDRLRSRMEEDNLARVVDFFRPKS